MTWIEQVEQCPGANSSTQLRNYIFYKKVEALLLRCPNILDDDEPNAAQSVRYAYDQIACGNLFEEFPLLQYFAILYKHEVECLADQVSTFASGIYTSTGTATTQDIAVPGAKVGDVPTVSMNVQAGTEVIRSAIAGANKITIVFSAAPTTASKVNWSLNRLP